MRAESEIKDKLEEVEDESWEAVEDSWKEENISKVNRGAVYGWVEALRWVLQNPEDVTNESGEGS